MMGPVLEGVEAVAQRQEHQLESEWAEEERQQRKRAREWRDQDVEYRNLEIRWNELDSKRRALRQTAFTLQTIAQVSGYMLYSEITCYVNMNVPDPSQTVVDTNLLTIWSLLNVFGCLMHAFLMVVTAMLYIAILQVSAHEGPEDLLTPEDCYSKTDNIHGVVMTEAQFLAIWSDRYEPWFQKIVWLFSWGTAVFFATLIPTGQVRFFMNEAAAWIQVGAFVVALVLWRRFHSSIVPSLMVLRGMPRD